MTTPEYPDTVWLGPPRAYGTGRDGKSVCLSVTHYTAGSSGPGTARAGAAYDKKRNDGTSCHVFHDSAESVQEVLRKDRSNSAFAKGNRLGVHHEYCATNQPTSWWMTGVGLATLLRGARAQAKDCIDFKLEPRRLSVPEVRAAWYQYPNGPRGICGHVDITRAFPEDGGTHTDPGEGFPWAFFITKVREFIGAGASTPSLNGAHVLSLIDFHGRIMVGDGMNLRDVDNGAQFDWIQKAAQVGFTGPWANCVDGKPQTIQVDDPDDLAAYGELPKKLSDIPGGEQLGAIVAAAIDSRTDGIVTKVVDEIHRRTAE